MDTGISPKFGLIRLDRQFSPNFSVAAICYNLKRAKKRLIHCRLALNYSQLFQNLRTTSASTKYFCVGSYRPQAPKMEVILWYYARTAGAWER